MPYLFKKPGKDPCFSTVCTLCLLQLKESNFHISFKFRRTKLLFTHRQKPYERLTKGDSEKCIQETQYSNPWSSTGFFHITHSLTTSYIYILKFIHLYANVCTLVCVHIYEYISSTSPKGIAQYKKKYYLQLGEIRAFLWKMEKTVCQWK